MPPYQTLFLRYCIYQHRHLLNRGIEIAVNILVFLCVPTFYEKQLFWLFGSTNIEMSKRKLPKMNVNLFGYPWFRRNINTFQANRKTQLS